MSLALLRPTPWCTPAKSPPPQCLLWRALPPALEEFMQQNAGDGIDWVQTIFNCSRPILWSPLRELWALPETAIDTKEHATIVFVFLASMAHRDENVAMLDWSTAAMDRDNAAEQVKTARAKFMDQRPGDDATEAINSLLVIYGHLCGCPVQRSDLQWLQAMFADLVVAS